MRGCPFALWFLKTELTASRFDSSYQRGPPLKTPIGVGAVIRGMLRDWGCINGRVCADDTGWDEGVPQMTLGEKAILSMTG